MAGLNRDERSWLRRACAGSAADLEELFRAHWPRSYRAAYLVLLDHALAEEIVLDSFLAATRTLDRFDGDRPFAPWLHQVVASRALDAARGEVARAQVSGESYLAAESWAARQPPPYAAAEAYALFAGIVALPPEQRVVIVLRHLLEYSPGEIAEFLEIPRSLVGSWLRRSIDSLRDDFRLGALRERDLRNLLLQQPVPDEHIAEERTWDVVRAAFAAREPVPSSRRIPWKGLVTIVLIGGGIAIGFSSVGSAIAERVRGWFGAERTVGVATTQAPRLSEVPGGGTILVTRSPSLWSVSSDGVPRRIGAYEGAAWSPDGSVVLAWGDGSLVALDPTFPGEVRWSVEAPDIHGASMSPGNELVAYTAGPGVRIVSGDGTGDRELAAQGAAATPAWRPGEQATLAFADPDGRVVVMRPNGKIVWRTPRAPVPIVLEWASDGRHLLAAAEHRIALFRVPRRLAVSVAVPVAVGVVTHAGLRPGRLEVAYAVYSEGAGTTTVSLFDGRTSAVLLTLPGRVGGLAWSPDGERLLVGWEQADQWLYVPVGGRGEVKAEPAVSAAFGGADRDAGFPRIVGWCCAGRAPAD